MNLHKYNLHKYLGLSSDRVDFQRELELRYIATRSRT